MPKANLLTRDLYRQIKSMNRDAMEKTINNIYDMGAKDALENAVIDLYIGKIRTEIGAVSGIGEKRLFLFIFACSAAVSLLERLMIELIKSFIDSLIQF